VKDRSKYLIDGASAVAPDAATGSKVSNLKASGSDAIKKKAGAKKIVARKARKDKVATVVAETEATT
jgi:hypothetical protein